MASLYQRKGSPFFWIKFRDRQGRLHQESTGCRIGVAPDVRRARQKEADKTAAELHYGEVRQREQNWSWVPEFLNVRYHSRPVTLERYTTAWATLKLFIDELALSPATFTRQHCFDYMNWRAKPDKKKGKYRAGHNTALLELKAMRIIMQEAVERNIITGNPCVKLGIKKERPAEKPELTDEDCTAIRNGIQKITDRTEREMLAHSFDIARYQGCRLSETQLDPMTDVDLAKGTIRFRSAKGGKDFVTVLHPALVPLFERLQQERRVTTWSIPRTRKSKRQWASARWWKFLNDLGLKDKGITFHGTRVTVISELARANVPENKAMSFVGHSSTMTHRIYQRIRPSDLSDCVQAVAGGAAGKPPSSSNPGAPSGT